MTRPAQRRELAEKAVAIRGPMPGTVMSRRATSFSLARRAIGGSLAALQAMAVSTGLPFTLFLLGACYAVIRRLMNEARCPGNPGVPQRGRRACIAGRP